MMVMNDDDDDDDHDHDEKQKRMMFVNGKVSSSKISASSTRVIDHCLSVCSKYAEERTKLQCQNIESQKEKVFQSHGRRGK